MTDAVGTGEGEAAGFAPIDLEQFAGQALKADGHGVGGELAGTLDRANVVIESGVLATVGVVRVSAGQIEHALDTEVLLKPGADLGIEDGDRGGALALGWLLVEGFAQHAGNNVAVMAEKVGNLPVGPAFLVEQIDG